MGHAILERVLLFGTRSADYIRASGHNGCIATEVILQATTEAEYMTAPERFADSQIPLAPRAPSIHDPSETWCAPVFGTPSQLQLPRGSCTDRFINGRWVRSVQTKTKRFQDALFC